MFTVEYRARVREGLIDKARADARIVSAAAVGGSAEGEKDHWSDIDLTFGLALHTSLQAVLAAWTRDLRTEFEAVTLFDLPLQSTVYRVFLLPGSLQVDLSFTPGNEFGALGPRFELLFGTAVERRNVSPASPRHIFGLGVHHAVRARFSIDRGRPWQAEYWISGVRDQALTLVCLRLGLEHELGRGLDALPAEILEHASASLVRSPVRAELLRSLRESTALLLSESKGVHEEAAELHAMLGELMSE